LSRNWMRGLKPPPIDKLPTVTEETIFSMLIPCGLPQWASFVLASF